MTADLAITEIQNFIEHLIRTAHYVKSQGYTSSRDMLKQTWEIAFDTYELEWGAKDEYIYGKIFDLNVDKLKNILEIEDEDEHEDNGSGDYLCDICDEPVNKEDWCFNCKDYVYTHHIND